MPPHMPCRGGSCDAWEPGSDLGASNSFHFGGESLSPFLHMTCRGGSQGSCEVGSNLGAHSSGNCVSSIKLWTHNVGGLAGLWRLLHLVHQFGNSLRPEALIIQEACCPTDSWIGIHAKLDQLGYQSWYTGANKGVKKLRGGVIIAVKSGISAKLVSTGVRNQGQLMAVEMNRTLLLGSYCPPDGEAMDFHCQWIQDVWMGLQWMGKWIWAGDWNMGSDEIIAQVALTFGGDHIGSPDESTRWSSDRCIDFFLISFLAIWNLEFGETATREEHVSDRKIVQTTVQLDTLINAEVRIAKRLLFFQPSWLSFDEWVELMDIAWQSGEQKGWREVCAKLEHIIEWSQEQEDDIEQTMIDYTWMAWELKVCWTYQQAYRLALQHAAVLQHEIDLFELQKVEHLANHFNFRTGDGKSINLKERHFPKDRTRITEKSRALLAKARRLRDLAHQISSGGMSRGNAKQILHLRKKLRVDGQMDAHQFCDLAKQCEFQAKEWSRIETAPQWKSNMKKHYSMRAKWLTRPFKPNPGVIKEDGTTTGTKNDAAHTLMLHWKHLGEEVAWQPDELHTTANEISSILRPLITTAAQDGGRLPNVSDMKNALTMIKGTHGVDGWTKKGLRGRTPTIIQQSKISCIGKIKEDYSKGCPASSFRPITVQSCFWRAWSTMWLAAPCNNWKNKVFPRGMAGASRGSAGPEVLAATADVLLGEFKHGISLDFSHAFDCVSSQFLGCVLDQALPQECRMWAKLLAFLWSNLHRWFHYGGHCHHECLRGDFGIPQGDPASPLTLLLLLLAGQSEVSRLVPGVVWQCIYMDDRLAITQDRTDAVKAAEAWQGYAKKIHLKENLMKTQFIDVAKASQFEGLNFCKSCEHLGARIGQPSQKDFRDCKKNIQRVCKAKDVATRVALLPCGTQCKVEDCKVFGLSRMAYGWIKRFPLDSWCKSLDKRIMHTLGQFNYGIFEPKQILIHAHLGSQANITFKLVRLLPLRNQLLEHIGFGGIQGDLEKTIYERLTGLPWVGIFMQESGSTLNLRRASHWVPSVTPTIGNTFSIFSGKVGEPSTGIDCRIPLGMNLPLGSYLYLTPSAWSRSSGSVKLMDWH